MMVQDLGLQSNSCRPQSPVNEGIIMSTGAIQTMAMANLDLFLENNFSLLYGMKIMHHLKSKSCDVIWKEKVWLTESLPVDGDYHDIEEGDCGVSVEK